MKILFLVPDLFNGIGGIQIYSNFLVKALTQIGHTLSIVSINDTGIPVNHTLFPLPYKFAFSGKYRYLRKSVFIIDTLKQALSFKPELILCGHVSFSPLCLIISRIFETPYFTITYGIDIWDLDKLKLLGLKYSNKILSISRFTKNKILKQLTDYAEKNIFILPCTFDHDKFTPKPKPEYLMERWKINKDTRILLTVARLSKTEKYKGYDKVIMAMKEIVKEIPDVKYILGGSGDDIYRIKSLIKECGLEGKVILTGFIPDEELCDYYNLCDVFVMPSKKEGFGIVFLEALACGKPVICGSKDGSIDAVCNGELGILVDPDNTGEITSAIMKILKGNNVDKRFFDREYLRKRVIEVYGFDRFKEKVEKVIGSLTL